MAVCRTIFAPHFLFSARKSILTPRNLFVNYVQNDTFSDKKMAAELGLPDKPKRPMTPFLQFMKDIRPQLLNKYNTKSVTFLAKITSDEWKKIAIEKKKEYLNNYEKKMQNYTESIFKYEQSLSLQQNDAIKKYKEAEKNVREKRALRKKMRKLNKPKRPMNSFMLFMRDQLDKRDPKQNASEWLNDVRKAWPILPEEKKAHYAQQSKKLFEEYEQKLIQWEGEMIREGHMDLVRKKHIIEKK